MTDIGLVAGVEDAGAGSLWVGTVDALLRLSTTSVRLDTQRFHLGGARLRALHADPQGTLWVATDRGLSRLVRDQLVPLAIPRGDEMPRLVDTIASDAKGGIWVFDGERGLLHWSEGQFDRPELPDSLARARVEATLTDSTGRVWIAFSTGDVATIVGHEFRLYGKADGLDGGVYQAIFEDAEHVVWLGATNGLTRYDGRFATTRSDHGFPVANVTAIVDDGRGTLWVGSGAGILQIRRDEWQRLLANPRRQAQFRLYDRADG
ncbi:MAG: two-component regulator propeller domain-containing protein, partial [Deltaproteobacteria bacterium]